MFAALLAPLPAEREASFTFAAESETNFTFGE
jgi:hypothetical protein